MAPNLGGNVDEGHTHGVRGHGSDRSTTVRFCVAYQWSCESVVCSSGPS